MRAFAKAVAVAVAFFAFAPATPTLAASFLWKKQLGTINDNEATQIATDRFGDIIVAINYFPDFGHATIIKYDSAGREIWRKGNISPIFYTNWRALAVDSDANVFLLSRTSDWFLSKYAPDGALLWRRPLNLAYLDFATYLVVDGSGNALVIVKSKASSTAIKYNSSGARLWKKTLGLSDSSHLVFADQATFDGNGNFIVTGTPQGGSVDQNTLVVARYGSNGALLSRAVYSGLDLFSVGYLQTSGIAADSSGSVFISGVSLSGPASGGGCHQFVCAWVAKFGRDGGLYWSRLETLIPDSRYYSVAVDPATGDVILGGSQSNGLQVPVYPWIVTFGSDGKPGWRWTWRTASPSFRDAAIAALAIDPLGDLVIDGSTYGPLAGAWKGDYDGFVAKLKP